jgi:ATP-binding cassette subfamily C protein CydC
VVIVPALFAWQKRKTDSKTRASRGALSTEATEFLFGFRDLKIYQQLEEKEQQLQRLVEAYAKDQQKEGHREVYSQSVNAFAALLVSLVVLGLGAYFVAAGELEGMYLAMLVMMSLAVFENVTPMAVFPAYYEESRKAANRLEKVVAEKVQNEGQKLLSSGTIGVAIENVSYTYPQEERPALDNVTLQLVPGSKTAIVGPSGSGKSTLMQIMLHILKTDSGSVLVNGEDVDSLDQEKLWSRINVVLQENHFFYGTIRSNLSIANEMATDEEMERALEKAELGAFSLSMKVEEKGQNLSGGEKQRLAIARAFLKNEALWLLDEPVSSIDSATAKAIYSRLFEQGKENTFVIISHDLSGLEKMDQIVVMEQGRIVEAGSYETLMARRGYFYGLKQIEKSVFS